MTYPFTDEYLLSWELKSPSSVAIQEWYENILATPGTRINEGLGSPPCSTMYAVIKKMLCVCYGLFNFKVLQRIMHTV
jgi:hypothetical protein